MMISRLALVSEKRTKGEIAKGNKVIVVSREYGDLSTTLCTVRGRTFFNGEYPSGVYLRGLKFADKKGVSNF